jgi:hypothetical protein
MATTHQFSVGLADRYGPIESIILSNICWWVETNRKNGKHFYDGRYWTYGSTAGFEKIFSYLGSEQIKYILRTLRQKGALLTGNYNRMRYDRTLWYSPSDEVIAIYECREYGAPPEAPPPDISAEAAGGEEEYPVTETGEDEGAGEEFGEGDWVGEGALADTGGSRPADGKESEDTERQKSHLHCVNLHNGNGKNADSIVENSTMDCGNLHDPLCKFPPPIPFININKKAAAAKSGDKPDQNSQDFGEKAAAADTFSGKESFPAFRSSMRSLLAAKRPDFIFSDGFYGRAFEWIKRHGLDPPDGYVDWLVGECEKRRPDNFRGLFFRLFFAPDLVELYKARGIPPPAAEEPVMNCPACGEAHSRALAECPRCGLPKDRYGDAGEVERQKRINALPPDVRAEYEKEVSALFFSGKGKDRDQWTAVEKKYHIIR